MKVRVVAILLGELDEVALRRLAGALEGRESVAVDLGHNAAPRVFR